MTETETSGDPPPAIGTGLELDRGDRLLLAGAAVGTAAAALTRFTDAGTILPFVAAAAAVAILAALVGRSVDQLSERFGAGLTGVVQSALGNLPELFIVFFALREGLVTVAQTAIVGSILANLLAVLGLAFLVGGLRHGVQRFSSVRARTTVTLLAVAVAAMIMPTVAALVHAPAGQHEGALSVVASIVLLTVFVCALPSSVRRTEAESAAVRGFQGVPARWPVWFAVGLLAVTGILAAVVSEWFVHALQPAIEALSISEAFAGLVIVAIAGNAVENVVGIQLAAKNQPDHALSVVLNSPLQIALVIAPLLVLLSYVATATVFTLVFPPLLVVALVLSVLLVTLIVYDGESIWLEGVALVGLYALIAVSFWWG